MNNDQDQWWTKYNGMKAEMFGTTIMVFPEPAIPGQFGEELPKAEGFMATIEDGVLTYYGPVNR